MEEEKMLLGLANAIVSCYGFIWKKEKTRVSLLKTSGIGVLGAIGGPLGMLFSVGAIANEIDEIEKKKVSFDELITSSIVHIISISKLIYPNLNDYDATLLAIMNVSVALGEQRIFNENVNSTPGSNGWGGKVLVSDACDKVNPLIETHFKEKNKGDNQKAEYCK